LGPPPGGWARSRWGRSPASPYAAGAACAGTVDRFSRVFGSCGPWPRASPPGCLAPTHRDRHTRRVVRATRCRSVPVCQETRNVPISGGLLGGCTFLRDQELDEIDDLDAGFHTVVVDPVLAIDHQ